MKVALLFRNPRRITPYEEALRRAGLDLVHITPDEPKPLDGLSGLVLTGGSDVNPARYGQTINGSEDVDEERDRLETDLLREALLRDLPVLAICRGLQVLNVAHGGTLFQHLLTSELHQKRCPGCEMGRHPAAHSVTVSTGTKLAGMIGDGSHEVNSRHHQAADRVGIGLVVSAVASDGVIEGLERPDKTFVVGVQWHPEDRVLVSESDRKLFEGFAGAVERKSGSQEVGKSGRP
jgi:putative glutamine amidotransferase